MLFGVSLSKLMTAYNHARWYAKEFPTFDVKRVDRAWGYIMSGTLLTKVQEYGIKMNWCECYDHDRGFKCKHMIGLMILQKAREI